MDRSRMPLRFILLLATLTVAAFPAHAQCPLEPGSVSVSVTKKPVRITYHSNLNRQQIAALQGGGPSGAYQQIGLTRARPNYRLYVEGSASRDNRGQTCAVLTKARITITVPELDVYITNDYRKGSCLYKAVLTHELKHVKILRDGLDLMIDRMSKGLSPAAAMAGVATGPNAEAALNQLKARVQKHMRPIFNAWQVESRRANAALDAKESFVSEDALCAQIQ